MPDSPPEAIDPEVPKNPGTKNAEDVPVPEMFVDGRLIEDDDPAGPAADVPRHE
jgi:hypothetical protein